MVRSANPIRDGRNGLRILPDEDGTMTIAIVRDLEFTRNDANYTMVELIGRQYTDIYTELLTKKQDLTIMPIEPEVEELEVAPQYTLKAS